ncbi:MAG: UDP-3-O-acyl-N-acetylglucosamine deacetylase [Thermoguttaceae bacterium]
MSSTIYAAPLFTGSLKQTFRFQNTIAETTTIRGFGFWTGEDVCVEFRPAPPRSGIVFVRRDIPSEPHIPARVEFREEKPRQTSLVNGDGRVDMVEHLLAAVKGLKIDNCEIWVDRAEMPGLDGSSRTYYLALEQAGIVSQSAIREVRLVTRSFRVGSAEQWIHVMPNRLGINSFRYNLVPDAGYPLEPQQFCFDLSQESFEKNVMASRTFVTEDEALYLLKCGLCQRVTPHDVLVLTNDGPLDNTFIFPDECARHKVLDMIGDFSLVDCDWVGLFESYRGGHALNAECVKQLLENSMLLDESFLSDWSEVLKNKQEMPNRAA